jgi:hypothetical protein
MATAREPETPPDNLSEQLLLSGQRLIDRGLH